MAAPTAVVFADVSSLTVDGDAIEACTGFQASRQSDQRPIYTWGSSKPRLVIGTPGVGSGSFTYIASDADAGNQDWSTKLDGAADIVVSGGLYPTGATETFTFKKCSFGGQSIGMNAKSEMTVSVNFMFPGDALTTF